MSIADVRAAAFEPLAPLIAAVPRDDLMKARVRISKLPRDILIHKFRQTFGDRKRVLAFLFADALIEHGIPPVFWHDHRSKPVQDVNRQFDAFVFDLRWLRATYPDIERQTKFRRCKAMLAGPEAIFHAEAEFAFYGGRRAAWKLTRSLGLSEHQQTDCYLLRSAPVAKRHQTIQLMRSPVFTVLMNDMKQVRRTTGFTDEDAKVALLRRHRIWLCAQMTSGKRPSAVAARYVQLTGESISRQVVAKQLEKIDAVLEADQMAKQRNNKM